MQVTISDPFDCRVAFIPWMYHSVFNHPPGEGHLDYFRFVVITNKAALTIFIQVLCELMGPSSGVNARDCGSQVMWWTCLAA